VRTRVSCALHVTLELSPFPDSGGLTLMQTLIFVCPSSDELDARCEKVECVGDPASRRIVLPERRAEFLCSDDKVQGKFTRAGPNDGPLRSLVLERGDDPLCPGRRRSLLLGRGVTSPLKG